MPTKNSAFFALRFLNFLSCLYFCIWIALFRCIKMLACLFPVNLSWYYMKQDNSIFPTILAALHRPLWIPEPRLTVFTYTVVSYSISLYLACKLVNKQSHWYMFVYFHEWKQQYTRYLLNINDRLMSALLFFNESKYQYRGIIGPRCMYFVYNGKSPVRTPLS
jgi:hypothetical protein